MSSIQLIYALLVVRPKPRQVYPFMSHPATALQAMTYGAAKFPLLISQALTVSEEIVNTSFPAGWSRLVDIHAGLFGRVRICPLRGGTKEGISQVFAITWVSIKEVYV